jgi:hypothetical protein
LCADHPPGCALIIRPAGENAPMLAAPGRFVYGTIALGALLAAESARQETYAKTIGAVALTIVLYWFALSYSEFAGDRLGGGEPFRLSGFVASAQRELGVLVGALVPFAVLLVWGAGGASLTAAVAAASWTCAIVIVVTEIVIGARAGLEGRELVTQTAYGVLLGLLVVALRVLLH